MDDEVAASASGGAGRRGHRVSAPTVAKLLKAEGFSLQANAKAIEGAQHPDRDVQFRYLNDRAREHIASGDPVISVDTKKKELVGQFKNGGREWLPRGEPERVNVHDFMDKQLGKAIPYGVYDVAGDAGWVSVGTDHDTAEFAVATIATWWRKAGSSAYPHASRLLITADGGGSNGYRTRLWKTELAQFAEQSGLTITVCHLPPGTSKWNKIEHRLFSHISMNWRGRPLPATKSLSTPSPRPPPAPGSPSPPNSTPEATPRASRSPTSRCATSNTPPSAATSSTVNGTTASRRAGRAHPENQPVIN